MSRSKNSCEDFINNSMITDKRNQLSLRYGFGTVMELRYFSTSTKDNAIDDDRRFGYSGASRGSTKSVYQRPCAHKVKE
jgi:hypothetical protein